MYQLVGKISYEQNLSSYNKYKTTEKRNDKKIKLYQFQIKLDQ